MTEVTTCTLTLIYTHKKHEYALLTRTWCQALDNALLFANPHLPSPTNFVVITNIQRSKFT